MNKPVFLLILTILAIGLPIIFNFSNMLEGYSNYELNQSIGVFPNSQTEILVQDTYPVIGKNEISSNTSNDIWWHYPIFELGSYKQITNNIKYPNNPDEGTCMPASMCGALYHKKSLGTNKIEPLPPISPDCGTRVGYFTTDIQLVDSLPYMNNTSNILY
jgi:hypothetical protein